MIVFSGARGPLLGLAAALALIVVPTSAVAGTRVSFASSDGVTIAGELFEASSRPAPAVVLVHMLSRNRGDWSNVADRIKDAGITALTIDLRGHGQSSGSADNLSDMTRDVRAAVTWLSARAGVRPDAIGLVGASLGASLVLHAALELPQVRAIGVLSPSLDYRGIRTDTGLVRRLGARRLWLAAGAEDPLALRTLRDMAAEPSGPREQVVSTIVAHGTGLLERDSEVARALVDWLRRSLLF